MGHFAGRFRPLAQTLHPRRLSSPSRSEVAHEEKRYLHRALFSVITMVGCDRDELSQLHFGRTFLRLQQPQGAHYRTRSRGTLSSHGEATSPRMSRGSALWKLRGITPASKSGDLSNPIQLLIQQPSVASSPLGRQDFRHNSISSILYSFPAYWID